MDVVFAVECVLLLLFTSSLSHTFVCLFQFWGTHLREAIWMLYLHLDVFFCYCSPAHYQLFMPASFDFRVNTDDKPFGGCICGRMCSFVTIHQLTVNYLCMWMLYLRLDMFFCYCSPAHYQLCTSVSFNFRVNTDEKSFGCRICGRMCSFVTVHQLTINYVCLPLSI